VDRIGCVDQTGLFTEYTKQGDLQILLYTAEEEAKQGLVSENLKEYFIIPRDYLNSGLVTRYSMKTQIEAPADVSRQYAASL